MEKGIEFYLGYLRNPKETPKDGFDEVKETEVVLYKEYGDYREIVTKEKVLEVEKNQVFDGHQFIKNQAGFIGRIGNKLTRQEAIKKLNEIRITHMSEYVNNIYTLIYDTIELAEIGEQEYRDEVDKFKNTFRK